MKILINNHEFNLINGNTFIKRLLGLMGKKNINIGIIFSKCNSIHTFFMKDKIDVLMLDNNLLIKYLYKSLPKNKIVLKRHIKYIIELPKHTIDKYNIKLDDEIKIH